MKTIMIKKISQIIFIAVAISLLLLSISLLLVGMFQTKGFLTSIANVIVKDTSGWTSLPSDDLIIKSGFAFFGGILFAFIALVFLVITLIVLVMVIKGKITLKISKLITIAILTIFVFVGSIFVIAYSNDFFDSYNSQLSQIINTP